MTAANYSLRLLPSLKSAAEKIAKAKKPEPKKEEPKADEPKADEAVWALFRFARLLVKTFEHTWGLDVKKVLDDYENWSNMAFERARQGPPDQPEPAPRRFIKIMRQVLVRNNEASAALASAMARNWSRSPPCGGRAGLTARSRSPSAGSLRC